MVINAPIDLQLLKLPRGGMALSWSAISASRLHEVGHLKHGSMTSTNSDDEDTNMRICEVAVYTPRAKDIASRDIFRERLTLLLTLVQVSLGDSCCVQ
jgi:hypothetical protein